MECNYQMVEDENLRAINKRDWKYFLRQVHVASGAWTMFYIAGLCTGAPTVVIPQLRKDNINIDDELSSWFYSVSNITAIPWVLILPSLTQWSGRRPIYIMTCIATTAAFIILYFSTTPYEILTSGVVQGFVNASNIAIMTLILTEYSSPKYRGTLSTIMSTSYFFGIWTSNAIGSYFYWKYIAVVGLICSVYTFTVALCPESPLWLASKGKFKKCEESFRWLRGNNVESNMELQNVIKSQIEYQNTILNTKAEGLKETLKRKEFYTPVLLGVLIGAQYNFSGKIICSTYAIEVLSKMTGSIEAANSGMLILDGVTIVGMYTGSFLSKMLKRRTVYLPSAFIGVFFLLLISLYLYLVKLSVLADSNVITILLLVCYSLSISCGCVAMGVAIYTEIMPIRYQTIGSLIISFCFVTSTAGLLKLTPTAFKYLDIHGSFLLCGIISGAFTVVLYLYLPETKGKTLIEIEEYFKDRSFILKPNQQLISSPKSTTS